MAGKILQVNFKFSVSRAEYEQAAASMAPKFAEVAGLKWKVWTMNKAPNEASGVYCFDDESSLRDYLAGPLAAAVSSHPALSDMEVREFEVMTDVTAITRGPV